MSADGEQSRLWELTLFQCSMSAIESRLTAKEQRLYVDLQGSFTGLGLSCLPRSEPLERRSGFEGTR